MTYTVSESGPPFVVTQGTEVIGECQSRDAAEGWARALNQTRHNAEDVGPVVDGRRYAE